MQIQKGAGCREPPPGKSQLVLGFLGITGADPTREAIGPRGSNSFSREVCTALSVKCVDEPKKTCKDPTPPHPLIFPDPHMHFYTYTLSPNIDILKFSITYVLTDKRRLQILSALKGRTSRKSCWRVAI